MVGLPRVRASTAHSTRRRPSAGSPVDLDACRRGDRQALGELFRIEAPFLERLIARMVGPVPEVEDLLQSTLVAAMEGFPRYRGEASVRTWLARIAVHVVHGHLRRPAERMRPRLSVLRPDAEPADEQPAPEQAVASRQLLARLYGHLDALGSAKRIAFALHVLEGRPIREVAAMMGASETATKSRVFFARRTLLARIRNDVELSALCSPAAPQSVEPRGGERP